MVSRTRYTSSTFKRYSPLWPRMSIPPFSTQRLLPRKMVYGQRGKCSVFFKTFSHPWHSLFLPTVSWPTKVSPFRLCGRITLTRFVTFNAYCLVWTTTWTNDTKRTQHGPRRPMEVIVGLPMVWQPLFGQNFRFVLGGLSRCFNCSIPRVRFTSYHHTRETPKRARSCTLLSPQLSLSLIFTSQSLLAFVFYSISALSYLPRQGPPSLDVPNPHCYTALACDAHGARDLLDQLSLLGWRLTTRLDLKPVVTCPTLQSTYIYTTSYYWARVPTVPKSPMVRSTCSSKNR